MIFRCRARTHETPGRMPVSRYTTPPETPGLTHRIHVSKLAGALGVALIFGWAWLLWASRGVSRHTIKEERSGNIVDFGETADLGYIVAAMHWTVPYRPVFREGQIGGSIMLWTVWPTV